MKDLYEPYFNDGSGRFPQVMRGFPYPAFLRDKGFDVICAPAASCYGDPMAIPDHPRHLENILAFGQAARRAGALGLVVTDWMVRRCAPPTKWMLLAAGCEAGWGHTAVSASHFWARFARHEYGPEIDAFLDASYALCRPAYLLDQSAPMAYDPSGVWKSKPQAERFAVLELGKKGPRRAEAIGWAREVRVGAARAEVRLEEATIRASARGRLTPRAKQALDFWLLAACESAVKADALLIFEKVEEYLVSDREDPQRAAALARALEKLRADAGQALVMTEALFGQVMLPEAVDEEADVRYLGELEMIDAYLEKLGVEPVEG